MPRFPDGPGEGLQLRRANARAVTSFDRIEAARYKKRLPGLEGPNSLLENNPATTYSPTQLPRQYHRRWGA